MSQQHEPSAEELEAAQRDFRRWAKDRSTGDGRVTEVSLVDVMGVSRHGFGRARKLDWNGHRRSLYWRWRERGAVLQGMDGAELKKLSDEFRTVRDEVRISILAVSESWWKTGGYGGLGAEGLRDGDDVQARVLPQGDGGDGDKSTDADIDANIGNQHRTSGEKSAAGSIEAEIVVGDRVATAAEMADAGVDGTFFKMCADVEAAGLFGEDESIHVDKEGDGTLVLRLDDKVGVAEEREETLLRIRPGRVGVTTLQTFENVLESMGDGHVYSLEIVSQNGEIELLVRTTFPERVAQHISSHYPGSVIQSVMGDEDPMMMKGGETGFRHVLHPSGDEWLPFQVYDEQQVRDGGDPFIDVLGGMMGVDLRVGERLVSRIVLRQQPHDWSEDWRARAMSGTGGENQIIAEKERRRVAEDAEESRRKFSDTQRRSYQNVNDSGAHELVAAFVGLMACVMVAYFLHQLWTEDKLVQFWVYGVGALLLFGLVIVGAWKLGLFRGKKVEEAKYYDPEQVGVRISGSAFQVEVHTLVFLGAGGTNALNRARQLLNTVNGVYRGFDNPLGCRFRVEEVRELRADYSADEGVLAMVLPRDKDGWDVICEQMLFFAVERRRYGLFGKPAEVGVIGVKEIVAFWHVPGEGVELTSLKRVQSKLLAPPSVVLEDGAMVGVSRELDGGRRLIMFPWDVMGRHHLYVARTRQGKSTLMCHVAGEKLGAKARGENPDALVVVDPHSDLIHDILARVPVELMGHVALLDLGGTNRRVGVNLLDTRVFDDRDAAVDAVIGVAKGIWENWGNRMEIILSYTLKAMYEANRQLKREGQLTMLDTAAMLTDKQFRVQVLAKVEDPFILEWWESSHAGWAEEYGKEAIAPVLTRMANYSGNRTVRSILGQRYCTLNVREVIERGDVLLVNTNQSAVGAEIASLVGASILKLVDTFVRKQGEIRENETIRRRRVTLIVDEMQSIQGVDFQSMLSEVGKFGGSLILATQSLSRLDELSPTMRDSILSNIGVLVCFQVNAVDAARLLPELRSEYLTEADITGLPQHNCYVRVATAGEVQAPFSMEVLPPIREDGGVERAVVEGSHRYARDADEVDAELAGVVEQRLSVFRDKIDEEVRGLKVDGNKFGEDGHATGIELEDLGKVGRRRRGERKGGGG